MKKFIKIISSQKFTQMNKKNKSCLFLAVSLFCAQQNICAQANTNLSNLTAPTAVNVNLLPGGDSLKNLGSETKSWKDIYFSGSIFSKGLRVINFGSTNTALGINTLTSNTGSFNTAVGYAAMDNNTTADFNTASGYSALRYNTTGAYNTASGYSALRYNTTGSYNTSYGTNALTGNTTGSFNTSVGYSAMNNNTTGAYNVAIGRYALINNSVGYSNVAIGVSALYDNTDRSNMVAIGDSALYNNGSSASFSYQAIANTAVGSKALYANTTGYNNTATGFNALYANTSGNRNTATGYNALFSNISGYQNTANGAFALIDNTTGYNNAAFGYYTLYKNTTGYQNVATGNSALGSNTTGYNNTANGQGALQGNTTGDYNIAMGFGTGNYNDNNTYCTFLGNDADQAVSTDFTNSMALGNAARISASNQVRIGNSSISSIGGYENWTNISDSRAKKNIKENVPGLQFINKLKPVTYNIDVTGVRNFLKEEAGNEQSEHESKNSSDENRALIEKGIKEKEKILHTGFLAQEVEKAAKEIGYDFSGVDVPKNESDYYGLRYAEFVVPLVKAVQELSGENEKLKNQNEEQFQINKNLQKQIDELKVLMNAQLSYGNASSLTTKNQSVTLGASFKLEQNSPNPFRGKTAINCFVPVNNGNVYINFYTSTGTLLKSMKVAGDGKNTITLNANELASGNYQYALVVDGRVMDTKQMIVAK